jgi:hypothetical protein
MEHFLPQFQECPARRMRPEFPQGLMRSCRAGFLLEDRPGLME